MLDNNFNGYATRIMMFGTEQDYKIGDIITNMVHWSKEDGYYEPVQEDETAFCYFFNCENLQGHQVDYEKILEDEKYDSELSELGIGEGCESEKEVIVNKSVKFEICEIEERSDEPFETEDFEEDNWQGYNEYQWNEYQEERKREYYMERRIPRLIKVRMV